MPYQFAEYPARSARLANAGQQLLDSIQGGGDRTFAIQELESAAGVSLGTEVVQRFQPSSDDESSKVSEIVGPDDAFSGILLDVQAANVLVSAGIALNQHGQGADTSLMNECLDSVTRSGSEVTSAISARGTLGYLAAAVHSSNLEEGRSTFRRSADAVLKDIVDGAASVVNSVLEQLKKIGSDKVLEGLDHLGESFQIVATAGRLIRLGLEKLKSALEALGNLLGKESADRLKEKAREIWNRFVSGELTQNTLSRILHIADVESVVAKSLMLPSLQVDRIDGGTSALSLLSDQYKSTVKLLAALANSLTLAAAILAFLHTLAPWVPLAFAGAYAALIAAAVVVAMNYAGSSSVQWGRSVRQIAVDIANP
jgi:hypothetical protein